MYQTIFTLAFAVLMTKLSCQNLPVRTAILFTNDRALIFKAGKVDVKNKTYSTYDIPEAFFGTYWVTSPTGQIKSIFVHLDTVQTLRSVNSIYESIQGKKVRFFINFGESGIPVEGIVEDRISAADNSFLYVLKSADKTLLVREKSILRTEFLEKPTYEIAQKFTKRRIDVNFNDAKNQQELGFTYLTDKIGWKPVYWLEMLDKDSARLILRAELSNDQEDLGDAQLRLATSLPNFVSSNTKSALLNFGYPGLFQTNQKIYQPVAYASSNYNNRRQVVNPNITKLENLYYYTIQAKDFNRYSRSQLTVFQESLKLNHIYECTLESASLASLILRDENLTKNNLVAHYVEFENKSNFPWVSGTVNILSAIEDKSNGRDRIGNALDTLIKSVSVEQDKLQPISQGNLSYTPTSTKCKLLVTKELGVKITHNESNVSRIPASKKIAGKNYDLLKIEAQFEVENQNPEKKIKIRIHRNIQAITFNSSTKLLEKPIPQIVATNINLIYNVAWELDIEPGKKQEVKYEYEIYVSENDF